MVNDHGFDELHHTARHGAHETQGPAPVPQSCRWQADDCDDIRAEARRQYSIAQQLRYEVIQLRSEASATVTVEVIRPDTPTYATQAERPIYAPETLGSSSGSGESPEPQDVVLHLDSRLKVTNLGTWIDTLA